MFVVAVQKGRPRARQWAIAHWAIAQVAIAQWAIAQWAIAQWAIVQWAIAQWAIAHQNMPSRLHVCGCFSSSPTCCLTLEAL